MSDDAVMSDAEMRRLAGLLSKINVLADDNVQTADPRDCIAGIRSLLAEYDRASATPVEPMYPGSDWKPGCPRWCHEHYDGTNSDGSRGRNHSSPPLAVTAMSAVREDVPFLTSTWVELREDTADPHNSHAVGVIEKIPEDVELSHCELRAFARHLLRVAGWVEEIEGAAS